MERKKFGVFSAAVLMRHQPSLTPFWCKRAGILKIHIHRLIPDPRPMQIPTLPNPDAMSAEERAAEITTILAACLLRISTAHQEKPEQKTRDTEARLGFLPDQRVHTTPSQHEELS